MLHTTWHHPFWNVGNGGWTEAEDLKAGDKLRSPDGETTQTVAAVKVWTGLKWMQDLTINDDHTYYVLAGNIPVLVHNCGQHRAEGDSSQDPKYEPLHLRPDSPDRIPLQHAVAGAAEGAINKWDGSIPNKILGLLPEGNVKSGLGAAGRFAYGVYYGRKAYRDFGGGYPAVHRAPDDYQGRHRAG